MNWSQFNGWKRAAVAASLLVATFGVGAVSARAEGPEGLRVNAPEFAVTYSPERGQVSGIGCRCFWMQGGFVEGAFPVYRGLSAAATFGGEHAAKIQPGVGVSTTSFGAGPRYTVGAARYHARIFGEALFGETHAFHGVYPSGTGTRSSASAFAMETGGGVDLDIGGPIAVRLAKVSYMRSHLPNNGTNTQDDLRLEFGAAYRFGGR